MTNRDMKEIRKKLMDEIRMAYKDFMTVVAYSEADLAGIQRYGYVMMGRMDMCIELLDRYELITENGVELLNGFRERFRRSLKELEVL